MRIDRITVIGGGNIGTHFACICASKGYDVTVYTTKAKDYSDNIQMVDADGFVVREGHINRVTDDLEVAMDTDLCFITYPAHVFAKLSCDLEPYVKPGMFVGVIPGFGGAEFAFSRLISKGAVLFGLQRVPAVARINEFGKSVYVSGLRDTLHLASIPNAYGEELSAFMASLFDINCETLDNYLSVSLTPSNPILHTTRLCSMFGDYVDGTVYDQNPLFYGEWNDSASRLLLKCDDEHQAILRALEQTIPGMDLKSIRSLKEHYENDTVTGLTTKISSIESLNRIKSPMKKTESGKWAIDFGSRYFEADFPYGLAIIEQFAELLDVSVPTINSVMNWYKSLCPNIELFKLSDYGIVDRANLINLYLQV